MGSQNASWHHPDLGCGAMSSHCQFQECTSTSKTGRGKSRDKDRLRLGQALKLGHA